MQAPDGIDEGTHLRVEDADGESGADVVVDDLLVEDVSIDGMCGVY